MTTRTTTKTVTFAHERPDYEVVGAIIEYFKQYPDSCHHPKEDIIYEKFKALNPGRAASITDLQGEHREGAERLRRVARIIDEVINDQDLLRESVEQIVRDFIDSERKHIALEDEVIFPAMGDATAGHQGQAAARPVHK